MLRSALIATILMVVALLPARAAWNSFNAHMLPQYSTTFPLTENPISESGSWLNGALNGTDWDNVQTTTNLASGVGAQNIGANTYGDPTGVLNKPWTSNQEASAVVYANSAVSSGACCKEVELRLNMTVTSGNITGYEIDCALTSGTLYLVIVRWNGPLANPTNSNNGFTVLYTNNAVYCQSGDTLSATNIGGVITGYITHAGVKTQEVQFTDTTYSGGAPGIGFYNTLDTNWTQFGFTSFSASGL